MQYPVIMNSRRPHRNLIVLFDDENIGTVLSCSDDSYAVGKNQMNWAMMAFKKYAGELKINNTSLPAARYPRVMKATSKYRDLIVLFYDDKVGTVLSCSDDEYTVGEYSVIWVMDAFEAYAGELKMSNAILLAAFLNA